MPLHSVYLKFRNFVSLNTNMERICILRSSQIICQGLKLCTDMLVMGKKNNRCDCSAKLRHVVSSILETNVPCRCEPSPLLCCAQLGSAIKMKQGLPFSFNLCVLAKNLRLGSDCAWSCWLFSSIRSGPVTSVETRRARSERRAAG